MTARVRCAGRRESRTTGNNVNILVLAPCGWKGERVKDFRAAELSDQGYREATTRKPCPRCGGRVEQGR